MSGEVAMTVSNRKSVALLSTFTLLGSGAAFVTQIVLARALGPAEYGEFSFALATITALAPVAGFGIQSFWLRVFGEEGWSARRWMPASLRFSALSTLAALSVVSLIALISGLGSTAGQSLLLLQFHLLSMAFLEIVGTRFLLEERPLALMLWQTVPQFLRLALVVGFLSFNGYETASAVSWLFAIVALATILAGFKNLVELSRGNIQLVGHGEERLGGVINVEAPRAIQAFTGALPYGLGGIFYQFYFQASLISLSYFLGPSEAGVYGAAAAILMAIYMVPNVIFQKLLLPRMHRWASRDSDAYMRAHAGGIKYMVILGLLAGVGCSITAPIIIPLIFGNAYSTSGLILSGLAAAVPLRFVSIAVGTSLSLDRFVRRKVTVMCAAAAICIVLNVLLIPVFGIWGGAVATVAGEAGLLGGYLWVAAALKRRGVNT